MNHLTEVEDTITQKSHLRALAQSFHESSHSKHLSAENRTLSAILGNDMRRNKNSQNTTGKPEITWARWHIQSSCPHLIPLLPQFDGRALSIGEEKMSHDNLLQPIDMHAISSNLHNGAVNEKDKMNERKEQLKDDRNFSYKKIQHIILSCIIVLLQACSHCIFIKSSDAWQLWANLHGVASSLHSDALESHHLVHLLPARASQNLPRSLHIKKRLQPYVAGGYRKCTYFLHLRLLLDHLRTVNISRKDGKKGIEGVS